MIKQDEQLKKHLRTHPEKDASGECQEKHEFSTTFLHFDLPLVLKTTRGTSGNRPWRNRDFDASSSTRHVRPSSAVQLLPLQASKPRWGAVSARGFPRPILPSG